MRRPYPVILTEVRTHEHGAARLTRPCSWIPGQARDDEGGGAAPYPRHPCAIAASSSAYALHRSACAATVATSASALPVSGRIGGGGAGRSPLMHGTGVGTSTVL